MNILKKIIAMSLCLVSLFSGSNLLLAQDTWIKPLAVGKAVKVTTDEGMIIKGILKEWTNQSVLIESSVGIIEISPPRIKNAKYLLVYNAERRPKKSDDEATPSFGSQNIGDEQNDAEGATGVDSNIKTGREAWKTRLDKARGLLAVEYIFGIAAAAGGLILYIDGENQRQNPEWTIKGNYLTNEDDVNEGNTKVVGGLALAALGTTLIVLGVSQGNHVKDLEFEGEHRGFVIRPEINGNYNGVKLTYNF